MYRFYLFRLMLRPKTARETLVTVNKGALLTKLLQERPEGEVRKDHTWLVDADFRILDNNDSYFKFGRIRKTTADAFDRRNWRFSEKIDEVVEYTDCIFLQKEQVLTIGDRVGMTVNVRTIAKYLCKLINNIDDLTKVKLTSEEQIVLSNSDCIAKQIIDPISFLNKIASSHKVSKYVVDFYLPNPPDFKALIQKPIEDYTRQINGNNSRLSTSNKDTGLDGEELASISRAAALTGCTVRAKVHENEEDKVGILINMKQEGHIAYIETEDDYLGKISKIISIIRRKVFALFTGENGERPED